MAAINTNDYVISPFNVNFALSGGTLFAKDKSDNYFIATGFATTTAYGRKFPYKAQVEEITYYFDENGVTAQGTYTLFCAKKTQSGGEEEPASIGSLNAREKVAMEVLNAMIGLTPNPLAYKDVTIKLLAEKAFEFTQEFINKAAAEREESGEGDGGDDGGDGGSSGSSSRIPSQSLDELAAVKKIYWCTQYPVNPEDGALYIKLRPLENTETVTPTTDGGE